MNYERTAIFAVRSIFVLKSGCIVRILYISNMNSIDRGESLNLIISNAGDRPIYEQIYTQIKDCIISGELSEGDMLPSIRALAKDLRISVITTTRAYDELERDGFIYRELVREEHLKRIEQHMREIVALAVPCGMDEAETARMLELIWSEEENSDERN